MKKNKKKKKKKKKSSTPKIISTSSLISISTIFTIKCGDLHVKMYVVFLVIGMQQ
jgi:hypothetical protein